MLDYKLIEALALVAREGGFDKAAKVLHITQSAVSQRIKLLEELTGQVLISRTTPPQATASGRKLLKHYLQVKQLEDDLIGEMNEPDNKDFTSIAVGINADSLAFWLLDAIHPFLLEEKVLLDIRVDDQEQTHRMMKKWRSHGVHQHPGAIHARMPNRISWAHELSHGGYAGICSQMVPEWPCNRGCPPGSSPSL